MAVPDPRYAPPTDLYVAGQSNRRGFGPIAAYGEDFTVVDNTPYFVPFSLSAPVTIDAFSLFVTAGATVSAKLFICTMVGGAPSALVPGTEVFLASSAWTFGAKIVTLPAVAPLEPGSYAATVVVSGGAPTLAAGRVLTPAIDPPSGPGLTLRVPYGATSGYTSFTASDTAATLIGAWANAAAPLAPRIYMRRAAV